MSDFALIDNYIYLFHVDKFILLPTYPESVQDTMPAIYSQTTPLSRSAPIFSYSHSGPRTIDVSLNLHRDMMQQLNYGVSNINLNEVDVGDDYVDVLVKQIQAVAVPSYDIGAKMVNPPLVALRFGNDIFIKGVVDGGLTVTYSGPIGTDNKYKQIQLAFRISEVDPYDAQTVMQQGSFRGINKTLERRIYKS